jgi:hypothetical protein
MQMNGHHLTIRGYLEHSGKMVPDIKPFVNT